MKYLDLSYNRLNGQFLLPLTFLSKLEYLHVESNLLIGIISKDILKNPKLDYNISGNLNLIIGDLETIIPSFLPSPIPVEKTKNDNDGLSNSVIGVIVGGSIFGMFILSGCFYLCMNRICKRRTILPEKERTYSILPVPS